MKSLFPLKKKLQWHSAASILNPAQATVPFVATAWNTTFSVSCQTLFLEKFCQDCVELALLQHIFTMFLALQITTHSQCHVCTRLFRYDNNESAGKSDWGKKRKKNKRKIAGVHTLPATSTSHLIHNNALRLLWFANFFTPWHPTVV